MCVSIYSERERGKRENPTQALYCQHGAWSRTWLHEPRAHDLSRNLGSDAEPTGPSGCLCPFFLIGGCSSSSTDCYELSSNDTNVWARFWPKKVWAKTRLDFSSDMRECKELAAFVCFFSLFTSAEFIRHLPSARECSTQAWGSV